jgi:hypothetical protein
VSRLLSKRSSPSSERGVPCSSENPARGTVLLAIAPAPGQRRHRVKSSIKAELRAIHRAAAQGAAAMSARVSQPADVLPQEQSSILRIFGI